MTDNELNVTVNCILALATQSDAKEKIKLLLTSLFDTYSQQGNFDVQETETKKAVSIPLHFTHKEIDKMATTFKKVFIANGLCAHVLKKPSGKGTFCFEIRYRANGYDIRAYSTDLSKAKAAFLLKTTAKEIEKYRVKDKQPTDNLLCDFFEEWHLYKKGTVTDKEWNRYRVNFNGLPEDIRNKPIASIKTLDIDKIMKEVKPRKYEELRTLFNGIFKYAIASGFLTHNPVALIQFKRAERVNRDALPMEEIYSFLERIKNPKFEDIKQGCYLLYFFGLRPCEVDHETRREGDFLIARNRKRKGGKIEYKKIPIPKQAQGLIDWDKPLTFQCSMYKRDILIKELLDDKTGYSFRHTFSTVCQQYVRPDIVDIWMGDSPQRLVGKVYTHFPDDFMRKQMDLVEYPTLETREK